MDDRFNEHVYRVNLLTCAGTGCTASGSAAVLQALETEITKNGLADEVRVVHTGCRGFCSMGPVMVIYPDGIFYCLVQASDVPQIVSETLLKGRIIERLLYREPEAIKGLPYYEKIPFYGRQLRIALRNCGFIDPEQIDEYIARGGYEGLGKALSTMTPQEVIDTLKKSGLRGRGGAGFSTGQKWEFAAKAVGDTKYIICNADEGDPGAFMDRSILEGDPHSVLEGMAVAGYAIGAQEGYIYCRAEYPLAIQRLQIAIKQAKEYGLLGQNIMGGDFSFEIKIKEGAGAFVCGEETALIASIEGRRGWPRPRPPFPAVSGLWGKPTNINNVETWANVPIILTNGADWFANIGTEKSKGTKVFALSGRVNNVGLVEVPMGITMGDIIFDIGGGIPRGRRFKAVQTGGPLGGCLPGEMLNTPVDYDSLTKAGATMGSGGMIVVDEDTCMVEFSKFFLTFAQAESCGQCTPCRAGGKQLLAILTRITEGRGKLEDLDTIDRLAKTMSESSLCALGRGTPNPVLSSLRYFKDEYLAHIIDKKCPAGVCRKLVRAKCVNACPAGVDVPSYLSLVSQGKFAEGLAIHRQRNPFALICGRVCPAFCEYKCRRGEVDEPVSIRQVKRFMADAELNAPWTPPKLGEPKTEKVAVVGSGPAGLTAAMRLAQLGYPVKVYEALPIAGGMLAVGIPDYRLPRDILEVEIDNVRRAGVEIVFDKALGRDFSIDTLVSEEGFSAVVLAIGAHSNRRLGIPGEELPGVIYGTQFLSDVALERAEDLSGKKVAIVGGGNVAIDSARMALRLGAEEVHVVYRRTREEMPAYKGEIEAAEQEGVVYHFLANPTRVIGNGKVTGLHLTRQTLGDFEASGRRKPIGVENSEYSIDVDVVMPAIGQMPDQSWMGSDERISIHRNGTFDVTKSLQTSRPNVFAAGDAVLGPATVVEAIAQGNDVAMLVHTYLRKGEPDPSEKLWDDYGTVELTYNMEDYAEAKRAEMPELPIGRRRLPLQKRKRNFLEVELGLPEDVAKRECMRCLRCDLE